MRGRGRPWGGRLKEERHAVSKINRAVSMKIAIKDRKGCNISAVRNRLKTVSQRRVDETKRFDSTLYRVSSWRDEKNWRRRRRAPNFIETVLARDEM
ncbi:hypothetical protein E2C01_036146 [Portunus trituberculatus]|uniref:Uncharacterized protein n=1 Tax=Portunus trituberculatus TaxID=210409 RepID=A0A5B7FDF0_PORTR|nr:hypothetical protein [Portunus trituberculatus]